MENYYKYMACQVDKQKHISRGLGLFDLTKPNNKPTKTKNISIDLMVAFNSLVLCIFLSNNKTHTIVA